MLTREKDEVESVDVMIEEGETESVGSSALFGSEGFKRREYR